MVGRDGGPAARPANTAGCMIVEMPRCAPRAPHGVLVASLALLTGCITSNAPLLTDAEPLLGERPLLQFYSLHDGTAQGPSTETFRWRDGRYEPTGGTATDIGPFTLHAFEGDAMIAQSLQPGRPTEYALVRKLADGAYFAVAIDEHDADEATRASYCASDLDRSCRVETRDAVLAFARAAAVKPPAAGGLALLVAEP